MQETIESIKFNRNPLQDEEDRQKRLSEQKQENNNERLPQTGEFVLNPNFTAPEELQIKNQRSSEQQPSEQNLIQQPNVGNFEDEEERERNNSFIERAKQNLAVTDFFLFFLGSFLLIYILLYIYVF
jgi:hypothetical protein